MTDPQYTLTTAVDEERERGAAILLEEFGSEENFLAALEATVKDFDDGDIVEGVVVKVDPEEVLLDIGFKSEGVIPSRELSIKHDIDPNEVVAVGDVIEALVLQKEDKDGRLVLSKKRAQYERAWGKIEEIHERESTVTGSVIEVVKGGLILDIGLRGFLPASLGRDAPCPRPAPLRGAGARVQGHRARQEPQQRRPVPSEVPGGDPERVPPRIPGDPAEGRDPQGNRLILRQLRCLRGPRRRRRSGARVRVVLEARRPPR